MAIYSVVQGSEMRTLLRAATAEQHARVDREVSDLLADGPAGYRSFLLGSASAVDAIERALEHAGVETFLPDWPSRSRRDALHDDLTALGVAVPPPLTAFRIDGEAAAFGALYVLEGSRLGAKILAKAVEQFLDPAMRRATRYLQHGRDCNHWPTFLGRLERSEAARAKPKELVDGALTAFAFFDFSQCHGARRGRETQRHGNVHPT